MAEMGTNPEAVGWYSGTVWISALLFTPLAGSLTTRRDPWRVSQMCLVFCAVGLVCIAVGNVWLFWLGAVMIGAGQALESPPASQLLSRYCAPDTRAFSFSVKQAGVQLGALVASFTLPLLAILWSASSALIAVSGAVLVFAIGMGIGRSEYPDTPVSDKKQVHNWLIEFRRGLIEWWPKLRSQPSLLQLSLGAASFGATQVCMNSFMMTWLVEVHHKSLAEAGVLAAIMQTTGLIARPLWGWVASHSLSSARVLTVLGLCMSLCGSTLGLWGDRMPALFLITTLVLYGLSASGWNGVYLAEIAQTSPENSVGIFTAVATMPLYFGLIIGPIAFSITVSIWNFSIAWLALGILGGVGVLILPRQQ
jgi:MFS family permease